MKRRGQLRLLASATVVGVLGSLLAGCGLSWSSDDSGRLEAAIEELASVGGPDGQAPTDVRVVSCDGDAEMPAGYATFERAGSEGDDPEATNAAFEELSTWYEAKWDALGWTAADDAGGAFKEVDGERLRAAVDAVTESNYALVVVREGAGMCS